ncbi:MAG: hypothetical protein ACPHJZ_02970 [Limisphaerales bacterium]
MKAPTDAEFVKIRALEQNGATRDEAWKKVLGYTAKEMNTGKKDIPKPSSKVVVAKKAKAAPAKKPATNNDLL